jgi:hypothetical protein
MDEPLTLAECPICSQLDDVETSYSKYGWPDDDRPLAPAAARLVRVDDGTNDPEQHHTRRCPVCGIYYAYRFSYEYYVNGSEDEETLERLTPTQARRFLSPDEYATRLAHAAAGLSHPHPRTRLYAAKCLAAQALASGDLPVLQQFLRHPDLEITRTVLGFLDLQASELGADLSGLARLRPELERLAQDANLGMTWLAKVLLCRLDNYAKGQP